MPGLVLPANIGESDGLGLSFQVISFSSYFQVASALFSERLRHTFDGDHQRSEDSVEPEADTIRIHWPTSHL